MPSRAAIKAGHAYILIEALDKTATVFNSVARRLDFISQRFIFSGRQAALLGAALSIPFFSATNAAKDFSDEILFLQSILQITDDGMTPLVKKIKELGTTTSFMATDVAKAATALGQGGFKKPQIIDSLQAVLDMARGARMELGVTAEVMVDTLTLFNLPANKASTVADKFFIAARNGTIEVNDLAQSFKYTAQSAADMGFSLDETLAVLSAMSKRMLKATTAGTSLNQFIISMAANFEKIKDPGKLGMDIFLPSGEAKPALQLLKEFAELTRSMPPMQKLPMLQEIFNVRGMRAAMAISNAIDDIFKNVKEMRGQDPMKEFVAGLEIGTDASRKAAIKMDSGIGGAIRRLLSSFNLLKIETGLALEKVLGDIQKSVTPILGGLGIWVRRNHEVVVSTLKAVGVVFAFAAANLTLGVALRIVSINLRIVAAAIAIISLPGRLAVKTIGALVGVLLKLSKVTMGVVITSIRLLGTALMRMGAFAINGVSKLARLTIEVAMAGTRLIWFGLVAARKAVIGIVSITASLLGGLAKAFETVGSLAFDTAALLIRLSFKMGSAIEGLLTFAFAQLLNIIGTVSSTIGSLIMALGPFIAIATAMAAIIAGIFLLVEAIKHGTVWMNKFFDSCKIVATAIVDIAYAIAGLIETAAAFTLDIIINSFQHLARAAIDAYDLIISSTQDVWETVLTIFDTSYGKIISLIEAGDMEAVWEVAMRTLKFAWQALVIDMQMFWETFVKIGKVLFRGLIVELQSSWLRFRADFIRGIEEIQFALQDIVAAVIGTFQVIFDALSKLPWNPAAKALANAFGSALAGITADSKTLFDEIIRSRELDRKLRDRQKNSPEQIALQAKIDALKAAAELLDVKEQAALNAKIDELEKAKAALAAEFKRDIESIFPTIPFSIDTEVPGGDPASLELKRLTDAFSRMPTDEEVGKKLHVLIPETLQRGTVEAAKKAYENQQTGLLVSVKNILEKIEENTAAALGASPITPTARPLNAAGLPPIIFSSVGPSI